MTAVTARTWVVTIVCLSGACAAFARDSLYDRLGGQAGVSAIARKLIDRVVADPVTAPAFVDSKLDRIKRLLAEQICELSGGPCRYTGDSMREVHAGQHITDGMFNRMVEDLRGVLDERHVDERSKNQLLRLLAPMKRDVIDHGPVSHRTGAPTSAEMETAPGGTP